MSSSYGWVITVDKNADELEPVGTNSNAKGMMGPSNIPEDLRLRLEQGEGITFKMYDDDGNLYYIGRIITNGENDEQLFAPLDDFGMPNAGATEIKYKSATTNEWETI
jgi:hypothetical protein